MRKGYLTAGFILVCLAGAGLYYFFASKDPAALQKAYVKAQSVEEKGRLINELEAWYMKRDFADSLSQNVQSRVNLFLDTLQLNTEKSIASASALKNVYELENTLQQMLTLLSGAVLKNRQADAGKLFACLQELAVKIDDKRGGRYWRDFVVRFHIGEKEKIEHWLKARQAAALCKEFDSNNQRWKEAEAYAGLALSHLQELADIRLRLDVLQSLQYILYRYHAYYELSYGIAERYLPIARDIHYELREMGLLYNYAKALHDNGCNKRALSEISKLLQMVQEYREVPQSSWYARNGAITQVEIYWKSGKCRKALQEANRIESGSLNVAESIRLMLAKANSMDDLGEYEAAEDEYFNVLQLAREKEAELNMVVIFSNLGVHFENLTELDKAYLYTDSALKILISKNPENYSERSRIIMNLAEIQFAQKNRVQYNKTLSEAEKYMRLVKIPVRKARRLTALARLNVAAREYAKAAAYIRQAVSIFALNGLLQQELSARIDLLQILMHQKNYTSALKLASGIYDRARLAHDPGKSLEALALKAELYYRTGRENDGDAAYDAIYTEIETLSSSYADPEKLILYRQKVYDILKRAVWHAYLKGRYEKALRKLNYAKARVFRSAEKQQFRNSGSAMTEGPAAIRKRLGKRSLILDYLIMPDSLVLFQLSADSVWVNSKKLSGDSLRKSVYDYLALTRSTVNIFANYNEKKIEQHYAATVKLSHKIAQAILGWPELAKRIEGAEKLFIIPDEFLYQLPFATLAMETLPQVRFLVQDADITIVPALSLVPAEKGQEAQIKNILISANPEFRKTKLLLKSLNSAGLQVAALTEPAGAISAGSLFGGINNYDGFISVNHGLANLTAPERSYLDFYMRGRDKNKGSVERFYLPDMHELDFSGVDFVMLFGCETATGKIYRGSGMRGFMQEYLLRGVRRVLASLWKVDASMTISLARRILQDFLQNGRLAAALRRVQIEQIERLKSDPYYKKPHPCFWGGFSVSSVFNNLSEEL